jgi:hypothetical protein
MPPLSRDCNTARESCDDLRAVKCALPPSPRQHRAGVVTVRHRIFRAQEMM